MLAIILYSLPGTSDEESNSIRGVSSVITNICLLLFGIQGSFTSIVLLYFAKFSAKNEEGTVCNNTAMITHMPQLCL